MPSNADGNIALHRKVDQYHRAFESRDVEAMLSSYAADPELTFAPGTFCGVDEVRAALEWDVRSSPTAHVLGSGIGTVVVGRSAVSESVIVQCYAGISYTFPAVEIFEFDDVGKIRRLRAYYDKLAIEDQIASRYPGVKGRLFRAMVGPLVRWAGKGMPER